MIGAVDNKSARIEFKTTNEIKLLLQKAAVATGMDLSSFLLSVSVDRAKDILKEEKILKLTNEEWDKFNEILNNPPKATDELKALMKLEGFNE